MPISPFVTASTVMEYLRPDKSPYFIIVLFGVAGVVYLCAQDIPEERFFWISVPLIVVLV